MWTLRRECRTRRGLGGLSSRESDVEGIQVRTLASEVTSFEHGADVAPTAAAYLRIAERIVDDPLVDRTRFLDIGVGAFRNFGRLGFHDSVGRNVFVRLQEILQLGPDSGCALPGFDRSTE